MDGGGVDSRDSGPLSWPLVRQSAGLHDAARLFTSDVTLSPWLRIV